MNPSGHEHMEINHEAEKYHKNGRNFSHALNKIKICIPTGKMLDSGLTKVISGRYEISHIHP
ncbi:MAG: hypothetical protein SV375_09820 [Thermodesulfobacteriota bacterium]|nr:hypothetical protein [Thermodesulfobacteriota bacterium]